MKKSIKIYIVASIITILGLGFVIFKMNSNNPESAVYKKKLKNFESKIEFYEMLFEADVLFYETNKPNEAIELLKSIDAQDDDFELINAKIKGYQKFVSLFEKSKKSSDLNVNDSAQDLLVLQKRVDSLRLLNIKSKDSLSNQIAELKAELIQIKKLNTGKENIQVISFKGVRGNKIHYIGEVQNNKANGNGIGIWVTGSVYKGEWKNNIRHGQGVHEWPDGEKYDGMYVEGKRQGFGKYYWPNGERYEGQWDKDQRNGKGVLFDPDGNIRFEGNWASDKPLKK